MENKRPFPGFVGASNTDNNPRYDCQRTVNYYTQLDPTLAGKEKQITELLQRPGLTFQQNLAPGPIRQMYTLSNSNTAIVVSGNQVYQLTSGMATPVNIAGTLGTDTGFVSISDNGGYVVLVDGTSTYYTWAIGATSFSALTDPHYYGASMVIYQDGFFLFSQPDSPNLFTSTNNAPQGGSSGGGPVAFVADNIAVKQGYADTVVGICSFAREMYVLGTQTGEVWYDSGGQSSQGTSVPFTFNREDGKNTMVGCIALGTIVQLAGSMFWLGQNPQGGAVVYYMNQYVPTRISTHAVEFALSQLGDLTESIAFGMQYQGHYFFVLQPTGSSTTWVYDVSGISETNPTPGIWTEWQSTTSFFQQGPFIASTHCYIAGQHLLGDTVNGNIYLWDNTAALDNSLPLIRTRQSPHFSQNLNYIFYKLLQVDFLAGQGLTMNGVNPSNAVNPQAILEISNDGGQTWSGPIYTTLGAVGKYHARARWAQLGYTNDRVFRVTVSDPIITHIVTARLDYEVGQA